MRRRLGTTLGIALLGSAACATTQAPPSVDVSGKWLGTWTSLQPTGDGGQIQMEITQTGSRYTGTILVTGGANDPTGLTEGFVTGNQVEIAVPAGMTGRLTVNGDEMTGTIAGMSGAKVNLRRQK